LRHNLRRTDTSLAAKILLQPGRSICSPHPRALCLTSLHSEPTGVSSPLPLLPTPSKPPGSSPVSGEGPASLPSPQRPGGRARTPPQVPCRSRQSFDSRFRSWHLPAVLPAPPFESKPPQPPNPGDGPPNHPCHLPGAARSSSHLCSRS
jgi:hypothetical protein